jgi:hypothetical protein
MMRVSSPGGTEALSSVTGCGVSITWAARTCWGVHHVPEETGRLGHRKLPLPDQPVPEGLPVCEGHDLEEEAVGLAGVEEGKDAGVLEVGGDPDLLEEALGPQGGGQVGAEDLQGHLPFMAEVCAAVGPELTFSL